MFNQSALTPTAPVGFKPVSTTVGQTIGSEIDQGVETGPTNLFNRSVEYPLENFLGMHGFHSSGAMMNQSQWAANGYNKPGVNFNSVANSDGLVSERVAHQAGVRAQALDNDNAIIANSSHSIAKFSGGTVGFFADPMNDIAASAGEAAVDIGTPLALNALSDVSGFKAAQATLDKAGAIPSFIAQNALKHGTTGALSMGAQATANAMNLNGVSDTTRALAAFSTLKQGFIWGAVLGIGGEGVGKVFSKLHPSVRPVGAESAQVLDTSSHVNLQKSALSQAMQGLMPDVTNAFKHSYNIARENEESSFNDSSFDKIDDIIDNLSDIHSNNNDINDGDILSESSVNDLDNQLVGIHSQKRELEGQIVGDENLSPTTKLATDILNQDNVNSNKNVDNKIFDLNGQEQIIVHKLYKHERASLAKEEMERFNNSSINDKEGMQQYLGGLKTRASFLGRNLDHTSENVYNIRALRDIANNPRLSVSPDYLHEGFQRQFMQPKESHFGFDPEVENQIQDLHDSIPDNAELNLARADDELQKWRDTAPDNEYNQEMFKQLDANDGDTDIIKQGLDAAYKCLVG